MNKRVKILGVEIDCLILEQAVKRSESFLKSDKFHFITTPNPEILLKGQKDEKYLKILKKADLSLPDGAGLFFASRVLDKGLKQRITGVDFTQKLLKLAEQKNYSVYFLISKKSLSSYKDIKESFLKKYPGLKIEGREVDFKKLKDSDLIFSINQFGPDILLTTFGAPKQEKWIYKNRHKFETIKIAMGVGGALDFISGKIKRAPDFLKKFGLEWLFRLLKEPRYRFKRIFNAVIVFPLKVLQWKIRMYLVYRKNAAFFILNNEKKVLIAHRVNLDQWQIPQGGIEAGESIKKGAFREIEEELGISANILKKIGQPVKNFHKYKWPYWHRLNKGFKGQKQNLVFLKFFGKNKDIDLTLEEELDKFRWVEIDNLENSVSPVRKKMTNLAKEYYNKLNIEKYV